SGQMLPIIMPESQSTAVAFPLVDDGDRLRGLLVGTGGAARATLWLPLATPGPRWSTVLDRLRSLDSAGSAVREGPLAHGAERDVDARSARMRYDHQRTAVVALGGNALAPAGERATIYDQFRHTRESLGPIVELALAGWSVCIVHGNGPQVGEELVRQELA